ncbi:minor capsid protein [Capybara microvirus Cap3_SP_535]|nr:minor capsid protein [Capybara microvirus Cap3_SP_535]
MVIINKRFDDRSPSVGIKFLDESLAQQQFKDHVDINNIVRQYNDSGSFNPLNITTRPPVYADCTKIPSYLEMNNIMVRACQDFENLPSNVRKYFQDNPYSFMDFCNDPANLEKGIELGLWNRSISEVSLDKVSSDKVSSEELKK